MSEKYSKMATIRRALTYWLVAGVALAAFLCGMTHLDGSGSAKTYWGLIAVSYSFSAIVAISTILHSEQQRLDEQGRQED